MKGDALPPEDHTARQCGGATIHEDGTVDGAAFRLRNLPGGREEYLSVNWLEQLAPDDRTRQLASLRQVFLAKGRKLPAMAKFSVHEVGKLQDFVRSESPDRRNLRILHEPFPPTDDSHSGIFDLDPNDDLIADLIAQAVEEVHPARG